MQIHSGPKEEAVQNLSYGYTADVNHGKKAKARPEYQSWSSMCRRCFDPKDPYYHLYGGKGVKIHQPWVESFWKFLEDMGPRPAERSSIDRVDNDGDYTPENCRWATARQQARNRSTNFNVTFNGRTQTLIEWSEETDIPYGRLMWRLKNGWSPEKAFTRKCYSSSFSDEEVEEILRRASEGESARSISRDYDVWHTTVWRLIKSHNSE